MSDRLNLVGIVGSLRAASVNRIVFDAAVELITPVADLVEAPVRDVPLYNGDVEAEGDPAAVAELKRAVDAADGLLFFTPEYNGGMPAVTKNAIDWLSRMSEDSALSRATVGVVAATPGGRGGAGARDQAAVCLNWNAHACLDPTHGIARIGDKLSDGKLTDVEARQELEAWLTAFVEFARSNRADPA